MTAATLAIWCAVALSGLPPRMVEARAADCMSVARAADERGEDVALVLSLVWEESKFKRGAVSKRGARGLFQLMPVLRSVCDSECEIAAGFCAVDHWRSRAGDDPVSWLAHYNGGNEPGRRAQQYARRVVRRAVEWDRRVAAVLGAAEGE